MCFKRDIEFQIYLLVSKGTMQIYAVEEEDKQNVTTFTTRERIFSDFPTLFITLVAN